MNRFFYLISILIITKIVAFNDRFTTTRIQHNHWRSRTPVTFDYTGISYDLIYLNSTSWNVIFYYILVCDVAFCGLYIISFSRIVISRYTTRNMLGDGHFCTIFELPRLAGTRFHFRQTLNVRSAQTVQTVGTIIRPYACPNVGNIKYIMPRHLRCIIHSKPAGKSFGVNRSDRY